MIALGVPFGLGMVGFDLSSLRGFGKLNIRGTATMVVETIRRADTYALFDTSLSIRSRSRLDLQKNRQEMFHVEQNLYFGVGWGAFWMNRTTARP